MNCCRLARSMHLSSRPILSSSPWRTTAASSNRRQVQLSFCVLRVLHLFRNPITSPSNYIFPPFPSIRSILLYFSTFTLFTSCFFLSILSLFEPYFCSPFDNFPLWTLANSLLGRGGSSFYTLVCLENSRYFFALLFLTE